MDSTILDHLKSLHTGSIDARNGYQEALDDAGGRGLTGVFREMIALHSRNADELASVLRDLGQEFDDDGSFMTTIHRAIMSVRALFGGLDESVLPGTDRRRTAQCEALRRGSGATGLPVELQALLVRQKADILRKISEMKKIDV